MKRKIALLTMAGVSGLLATTAQAEDILARVVSSTPVVQQIQVPRQVCNTTQVTVPTPNSGGGALMGAIAGGAMGNAVGDGGGRALATVIGLVGGAALGNNIEGPRSQVQNVQQCGVQISYENRTSHYDVVYEYADKRHSVQMQNDPGLYVRLQVSPVGAVPQQGQQGLQAQQYQQPQFQQYQQYQQPITTYVQPAQVYVQPAYVQAPPVIYAQPYSYARPYYAPIGLSLNLGYSRFHGRHHHWR